MPVLERVCAVELQPGIAKEIIVIDDASTDQSLEKAEEYMERIQVPISVRIISHERNLGKGGAVRTGISMITGDYLIIQDADLELDPADYRSLLEPIINGEAEVVYGSRFLSDPVAGRGTGLSVLANRFLTWLSNLAFGTRLTDMETCYKLLPAEGVRKIKLEELRFGFEPEITAKIARNREYRIREVPVTYHARTGLQGKKIGWMDGFRAVYCIFKYGILKK